jgi:hypothetical protein
MATTASLKQIFYPGFLEDMIIERVQGILYDNAKEVAEEKKAEIKVYEDQCVSLQEDLVKAQNKVGVFHTSHFLLGILFSWLDYIS